MNGKAFPGQQKVEKGTSQRGRPEPDEPLLAHDGRWREQLLRCTWRKAKHIARGDQHRLVAGDLGVAERSADAAKRAKAGPWPVVDSREARPAAAHHDDRLDLGCERIGHVGEKRLALVAGERLVRAKAPRLAAGEDRTKKPQAVSSNSSRPIRKRRISEVPAPIS